VFGILKRVKQTHCKVIKVLYSVSFKNLIHLDQKAVIITLNQMFTFEIPSWMRHSKLAFLSYE